MLRQAAPLPRRWLQVPLLHQSERLFSLHKASDSVQQQPYADTQTLAELQRTASPLALQPTDPTLFQFFVA